MIKLTRTETIELPSWEEVKQKLGDILQDIAMPIYITDIYNRPRLVCKFYWDRFTTCLGMFTPITMGTMNFKYTKQGYQQAVSKLCELGNFKREVE